MSLSSLNHRRLALCALASASLIPALVAPHIAQAQTAKVAFNIDGGSLDRALMAFAAQSKLQLLYNADTVEGRKATALKGVFTPREALDRLLSGSDIDVRDVRVVSLLYSVLGFLLVVALTLVPGYFGGGSDDWHYLNAARCWVAVPPMTNSR